MCSFLLAKVPCFNTYFPQNRNKFDKTNTVFDLSVPGPRPVTAVIGLSPAHRPEKD